MNTKSLLPFSKSGSGLTAIEIIEIEPEEKGTLQGSPEELVYYVLDGRGIISIYEQAPEGDVYELRQDICVYMTPMIKYELHNIGNTVLRMVAFRVKGGVLPGKELAWSAISQRGVTVDKPVAGSGVAVTRVMDEGSNPSEWEGQHLRIHDVWLRRPQIVANAEVLWVAPGRSTRLHNHYDTDESCYILYGEGNFIWDDKKIPFGPGDVISYPLGVKRKLENTGMFPMAYLLVAAHVKQEPESAASSNKA